MENWGGLEILWILTFPLWAVLLCSRIFCGVWLPSQSRFMLLSNSILYLGLAAFFYFFIRIADRYFINYCSQPQYAYSSWCNESILEWLWWLSSYPYRAPFWASALCVALVLIGWGLKQRWERRAGREPH